MTLKIDLRPEVERGLLERAQAKGVSIADFAQEILAREAMAAESAKRRAGQELVDACVRVRGLLTDEEIEILFSRARSQSRPLDFS